jgi:outer membrane immunogenic protein
MKKLLLTAAAVVLAAPAFAADMPRPVAKAPVMAAGYNWTGGYVGLHAGGTWGRVTATETGTIDYNGLGNSWTTDASGFVGGGQFGYNWQAPGSSFVWGLEADIGYLGLRGTGVSPLALTQASATQVHTDGGIYATVRGRLGFAANNVLIYGTGGAIFADVGAQITDPVFATPIQPSSHTGWQAGWTAGGGVEFGFGSWSLKGEYLYYDLGRDDVTSTHTPIAPGGHTHGWDIKTTGHIARVGLNYRFRGY